MKPLALLIGFSYFIYSELYLPGITYDIYQVFHFFKERGFDVVFLLDNKKDEKHNLAPLVREKNIEELFTFVSKLFAQEDATCWESKMNENDMFRWIAEKVSGRDKVVWYFTGHAQGDYVILPNKNMVLQKNIKETLCKYMNPYGELFIIQDCCHASAMETAYMWKRIDSENAYWIQGKRVLRREIQFRHKGILIQGIGASNENTTTQTSVFGSFFTKALLECLRQDPTPDIGLLSDLLKEKLVKKDVTPRVYDPETREELERLKSEEPFVIFTNNPTTTKLFAWLRYDKVEDLSCGGFLVSV